MSVTPRDMEVHVDHELSELLRVGRLIQSDQYAHTPVDAPLREAFASHFRKLCEFFGVKRTGEHFRDSKATDYVPSHPRARDERLPIRLSNADKLQAHVSDRRKELEHLGAEWGESSDTALLLEEIRRFIVAAGQQGYSFDATNAELRNWP